MPISSQMTTVVGLPSGLRNGAGQDFTTELTDTLSGTNLRPPSHFPLKRYITLMLKAFIILIILVGKERHQVGFYIRENSLVIAHFLYGVFENNVVRSKY